MKEWLERRSKLDERRDTHDFFDKEHVAQFLRNHMTGTNNLGRFYLSTVIAKYSNPKVLDIAGGTGVNFEVCKNHKILCQYTLYDRTQQFLDFATFRYGNEINTMRGYAEDLPYHNEEYDIAILRHIGEHMLPDHFYKAILEAFRIASKETIIVFFITPGQHNEDIVEERGPDERGCYYYWNTYSWPKLTEFFSTLGAKIETKLIQTPDAAAPDFIVRLIK